MANDTFNLHGVDLLAVGKANGHTITSKDLEQIVEASKEVGFTPPVKKGHTEDKGAPALGWVENIRTDGEKLYGDLMALDGETYSAIKNRRYDARSAELYMNVERNGKKFPKALKALALLGAEIPAVSNLKPLHSLALSENASFEKIVVYEFPNEIHFDMKKMREHLSAMKSMMGSLSEDEKKEMMAAMKAMMGSHKEEKMSQEGNAVTEAEMKAKIQELEKKLSEKEKPGEMKFTETAEYKEQTAKIQKLEADLKARNVADKVKTVRLPAARPSIQALLELTHGATQTVKFSQEKGKEEEVTAEKAIEKLIEVVNASTAKLFTETSGARDTEKPEGVAAASAEDAQNQLVDMANKMVSDGKAKDFSEAWPKITSDPTNKELVALYAQVN